MTVSFGLLNRHIGSLMTKIQKHMLMMFISLRWGVGIVGILLPIVLGGVGYCVYRVPLAGSMSAYYHATKACSGIKAVQQKEKAEGVAKGPANDACLAIGTGPMRNWFVGSLFFIGGAMLLIRGFSNVENWALNIAGIMAPCVALFPMNWGNETGFNPHLTFAIIFFLCVGFTSVFCCDKTLKEIPQKTPDRVKVIGFYKRWYRLLGTLMIALPICAHLFLWKDPHRMFFVEAAGVWAFGAYWLFKTFELKRSDIEYRALKGDLPNIDPHALS
jgi:hypothetical protein